MTEIFLTIFFISILLFFLGSGVWVALSMIGVSAIGMMLFTSRPVGDAMCFCPPLIITDSEIDSLFDRYSKALDEGLDHLTKEGKAVA